MPLVLLEKECGPKCKSRKHVQEIISVIARGNLHEFEAYSSLCHNWARHSDVFGRTALHLAASCGKTEILEWLLEEKKLDVITKDFESGYTALHRAVYYGQLSCARMLTQFGADVQMRDVEGLSPLDIAMMDRPPQITYTVREPNEVYTWGENNNSTLGHSSPHKRSSPEAVDMFKKMGISIRQIVLCKYHSVFLTQSGHVYTCGHGQGGRLGHDDQHTVLVPRLLESVKDLTCVEIAAATDHTVLRMEGGLVYSFGLNPYHQLGQTPVVENSPMPKLMNLKTLKGKTISGVCVGRFHSVVWTPDSMFTVGLNAGQLGHQRGEKFQSQLRQVSSLRHTDIGIARVACSDAATVCLTTKGDVFVLHDYSCKKILSKGQEIDQVLVTGGTLDHSTGLDILSEKGGQELLVMLKNESGVLLLWRSSDPSLKRCHFALRRQLSVSDVAMTNSSFIFSTSRGEAFVGYLSNKKTAPTPTKESENKHSRELVKECGDGFNQTRLLDLLYREPVEEVQVRRVPVVHRAVRVTADRKGRNFAVLQALPNGCMSELPSVTTSEMNEQFAQLLREADSTDNIHDAIIQVGERSWPVHQYIIAMRSDHFRNMVTANSSIQKGEKMVLKVDNVKADIMEQLINFIYTDMCDFLQLGFKVKSDSISEKDTRPQQDSSRRKIEHPVDELDELIFTKGLSAYQVQEKRNQKKGKKKDANKTEVEDNPLPSHNPVKMLQEAARKFGVKGLSKRLDAVKCSNDVIVSQGKNLAKPKVKFDRTKLPELYDVTISSEDGQEIRCHKCVLVARLEYFYSMLATGWVETFNTTTLTLPVSGDVLEILIDFLYSDDAPQLKDCTNEELLCNVLIVSDQLLAWRLKEMCEVALANNIAFKNVSELLEFSTIYNADQLKLSCQQFICLNLAAMIEGRYLDVLSQDTLGELTAYYRSMIPSMAYRVYTPDNEGPSQSYLDDLVAEFDMLDSETLRESGSAKKGGKQQRKRNKPRKQSTSEDAGKTTDSGKPGAASRVDRNLSICSDISNKSDDDFMAMVEEINRQAEEAEKKHVSELARAKETKEKFKVQPAGSSRPLPVPVEKGQAKYSVPTQPEDVPRWTSSYQTLSWANTAKRTETIVDLPVDSPAPSPVSPSILASSPTSLRDIMQKESESTEKRKSPFSSRISWKDVKKQQNKDSKEKQQKTAGSEPAAKPAPKPSHKAAWGSVETAVKSFRDLMIEDKHAMSSPIPVPVAAANQRGKTPSSAGSVGKSPPPGSASWGLSMPAGRNAPSAPQTNTASAASPPSGSENPWQRRAALASSPPSQTAVAALDFSAILKDEREKSETLERATQKPLALIQLEEQAMNELLNHYNAGKDPERYITVERVSKAMAAPLWRRDRQPPGAGHL